MRTERSSIIRHGATAAVTVLVSAALVVLSPAPAYAQDWWGTGRSLIGADYEHVWGAGHILYRYNEKNGCTLSMTDVDSPGPQMPSGWNDKISSFVTEDWVDKDYYPCYTNHYWDKNYGGRAYGWSKWGMTMGDFNDKTSSVKWT